MLLEKRTLETQKKNELCKYGYQEHHEQDVSKQIYLSSVASRDAERRPRSRHHNTKSQKAPKLVCLSCPRGAADVCAKNSSLFRPPHRSFLGGARQEFPKKVRIHTQAASDSKECTNAHGAKKKYVYQEEREDRPETKVVFLLLPLPLLANCNRFPKRRRRRRRRGHWV